MANNLGVLIGYSSQSTLGTSELLRHGIHPSHLSLVFLAGPISGLFVQPIVGLISDKLRQRRPFILLGAISVALSLLAMACATGKRDAIVAFCMLDVALNAIQAPIRAMISDALPVPMRRNATALLTAFGAMGCLVSGGLAARQWEGLRKWMGFDVDAQVVLTMSAGIALLSILPCAFLAPETPVRGGDEEEEGEVEGEGLDSERGVEGMRRLKKKKSDEYDVNNDQNQLHNRDFENNDDGYVDPNDDDANDDHDDDDDDHDHDNTDNPTAAFLPHPRDRTTSNHPSAAARKQRTRGHLHHPRRNLPPTRLIWPRPFWQTFIVQLCTWSGFFAFSVYGNAWVGTSVFGGDGSAPISSPARLKFDAGVRLGSFAQALSAVIMFLVSSFVLPYITSVTPVYALSQVVEVLSLCTPLLLTMFGGAYGRKVEAVVAVALFGVVSAVTNIVPWLVMAQALHVDERTKGKIGLYTTVFNVSQAVPQLVLGAVAPGVMILVGNRPPVVMALAGGVALLGLVLIFVLRIDTLADGRKIVLTGAGVAAADAGGGREQDAAAFIGDATTGTLRMKTNNKKTNGWQTDQRAIGDEAAGTEV